MRRSYRGRKITNVIGFNCKPGDFTDEEEKNDFIKRLCLVEGKAHMIYYTGTQFCSISGENHANIEYHYEGWRWPDNYKHSIWNHNVEPGEAFRNMVMRESDALL